MDNIYVIYEERESSHLCGVKGVWADKENAVEQMKQFIQANDLYNEFSRINIEEGCSESDPFYNGEVYSNYYIKEMNLN